MRTSGNTILITGGGSGIGRGLAEAFAADGNTVIIAGRRKATLDAVVAANPGMTAIELDVGNAESVAAAVPVLLSDHAALNIVVHNAGVMAIERVADGRIAEAETMIATNLLGPIRLTAALLPHLLQQPAATIMTVSSGLAFVPLAVTPTYCATKAAIHSYSQSLREQLKHTSVKVVEIAPPYVQTELMGPEQANDERAMPLRAFIDETMALLRGGAHNEIIVERCRFLRDAEQDGRYDQAFAATNALFH